MPLQSGVFSLTVSDAISLSLSGLLVLLYWKMYRTQEGQRQVAAEQTRILDRQSEIMSLTMRPAVTCDRFSADDDTLFVRLSNDGTGTADRLQVKCALYGDTGEDGEQFVPAHSYDSAPSVNTAYVTLVSTVGPDDGDVTLTDRLHPDQTGWFEADPVLTVDEREQRPLSEAVAALPDWEVNALAVDFYLGVDDTTGRQTVSHLATFRNVPRDVASLEDVVQADETPVPVFHAVDQSERPSLATNVEAGEPT